MKKASDETIFAVSALNNDMAPAWVCILRRWFDMITLSFIGVATCIFLKGVLDHISAGIGQQFGLWKYSADYFAVASLCGILALVLVQLGAFRLRDLWSMSSFRYPPVWVAAFIGVFVYVLTERYFLVFLDKTPIYPTWVDISSPVMGFIIAVLSESFYSFLTNANPSRVMNKRLTEGENSDSVLAQDSYGTFAGEWLQAEQPVRYPAEDLFSGTQPARRICRLLLADFPKTVGLLGGLGAGKSSVLNFVAYYLREPGALRKHLTPSQLAELTFPARDVLICSVSTWGLVKGSVAKYILDRILHELKKHADILAVAGVPAHYHSAMSGSGITWGKALIGLVSSQDTPDILLSRIDSILRCVKMRLVVFLEDIERNREGSAFYEEVGALLDHLRTLDNITFILACGQEHEAAAMLARVCEHTEIVPALKNDIVRKQCIAFRKIRLDAYANEDIDCLSGEVRDARFGITANDGSAFQYDYEHRGAIYYVATLLNNPRLLKKVFQKVSRAHDNLHGEIDFDDLFVTNVLRIAVPEAFAFVDRHIRRYSQFSDWYIEKKDRESSEASRGVDWLTISAKITLSEDYDTTMADLQNFHRPVKHLITFLLRPIRRGSDLGHYPAQSLSTNAVTEYWVRLNAEEMQNNELRDQTVLHGIAAWRHNASDPVVMNLTLSEALLRDTHWVSKIERLGMILSTNEIRTLCSQYFSLIRERNALREDTDAYGRPGLHLGYTELKELASLTGNKGYEDWIREEILTTLGVDLRLANDLYNDWCQYIEYSEKSFLLDKAAGNRVREAIIKYAGDHYVGNPQLVTSILGGAHFYNLKHFIVLYSTDRYEERGFVPDEWYWFGKTLVDAASLDAQKMVPELIALVSDANFNQMQENVLLTFHHETAEGIFRGIMRDFMTALTFSIDLSCFSLRDRRWMESGQQYAREWLLKNGASSSAAIPGKPRIPRGKRQPPQEDAAGGSARRETRRQ